jgi:hypothetical protein
MTAPTRVTTDYVRRVYSRAPLDSRNGGKPNPDPEYAAQQFDEWLAERDRSMTKMLLNSAYGKPGAVVTIDVNSLYPDGWQRRWVTTDSIRRKPWHVRLFDRLFAWAER